MQKCWLPRHKNGFLMSPDPISDLTKIETGLPLAVSKELEEIASKLPNLISSNEIRKTLKDIKTFDLSPLRNADDFRIVERAFQIYAHLANAYVWCEEDNPTDHIPEGVAVPLVELAKIVERPPIIPYASTALSNFERIDPKGEIVVENLRCIQKLIDIQDESWFHLIHVEIEAHAGSISQACILATLAIEQNDTKNIEAELLRIPRAFNKMITTFKRMFEKCSPDIYFHTLRPYLFGFTDIVYIGVEEFKGKPQTYRGESGAQSTVIPAIQAFLGLRHEKGGLTEHLEIMKAYMPKPHRELLNNVDQRKIRDFIITCKKGELVDAYNSCLQGLFKFRSLPLKMAHAYVAQKVSNPIGTGGTEFMRWLKQLRDETEKQYI